MIIASCPRAIYAPLPNPSVDPAGFIDVGFIFLQSNASGQSTSGFSIPTGLLMWSHVIGQHVPVGLEALGPYTGNAHGIEMDLAGALASKGVTFFCFKVAQGATGLHDTWLAPTGTNWPTVVADWGTVAPLLAAQYPGKTIRIHIIPIGGEFECALPTADPRVSSFAADLATTVAAVRTLVGVPAAGLHLLQQHNHANPVTFWPSDALVQAQITSAAASISNTTLYTLTDLAYEAADLVHYNTFWPIARAMAAGILATI